jgi:hypothetical protein
MELFVASIGGMIAKIYDDIVDNNINVDESIKSSLWTLSCFILALLSHNDFLHSFIMYFGNFTAYMINPESFELNNEKSLLFTYPLLLLFSLLSFTSISSITFFDLLLFLLICIGAGIETYIFQEDTSIYKLSGRIIAMPLCIIGSLIKINNRPFHFGIQKLLFYSFGYVTISCILLTYKLYKQYKNKYKELEKDTI